MIASSWAPMLTEKKDKSALQRAEQIHLRIKDLGEELAEELKITSKSALHSERATGKDTWAAKRSSCKQSETANLINNLFEFKTTNSTQFYQFNSFNSTIPPSYLSICLFIYQFNYFNIYNAEVFMAWMAPWRSPIFELISQVGMLRPEEAPLVEQEG